MTGTPEWQLRCAARTERGLVRKSNDDSVFAGTRLFAVADGFGTEGAEVAGGGDEGVEDGSGAAGRW